MGKCKNCNGSGEVRGKGWFDNIISRCMECGGTGTDIKPQCPMHKISHKYSGAIGWYCPRCESSSQISWWDDVYRG